MFFNLVDIKSLSRQAPLIGVLQNQKDSIQEVKLWIEGVMFWFDRASATALPFYEVIKDIRLFYIVTESYYDIICKVDILEKLVSIDYGLLSTAKMHLFME